MENSLTKDNRALSSLDWHMKFLKSWRFIVVVICFVLTAPIALLTFQVGDASLALSEFLDAPLAVAQAEAEEARRIASEISDDPNSSPDARQTSYQNFQHRKSYANRLWFARLSSFLMGLAIVFGAVCTLLLIPLALLTPINAKTATIAMQGIFVILKARVYALYLLFAGVLMGMPGFGSALNLFAQSVGAQLSGDMSFLLILATPVLAFHFLILRNVSIIATDVAKALRTNKFPGAFGLTCGLTWQGIVMMSISLLGLLLLGLILLAATLTEPGAVRSMLDVLAQILPAFNAGQPMLISCMLWLGVSAAKFAAIAWCYPEYIRLSQEMKGCAADALIENTTAGATPVYYRRY